ncbi:hypothetical protein BTJ45_03426 [Bacillus mycoides]|nr:hypothetical protein BTJ45_03426 [Bacillus mycoides]
MRFYNGLDQFALTSSLERKINRCGKPFSNQTSFFLTHFYKEGKSAGFSSQLTLLGSVCVHVGY